MGVNIKNMIYKLKIKINIKMNKIKFKKDLNSQIKNI